MSTTSAPSAPRPEGITSTGPTKSTAFKGFKVPYILSWRNPQETGILLVESLGLFIVFSSTLTLRLFLRASYWAVGIVSLVELATRYLNGRSTGMVNNYQPSRFLPLSDSFANDVASAVSGGIRRILYGVQHVVDARDPESGLKLTAGFFVAYVLLGFLALKTLVLVSILAVFGLPPLYLQFKTQVDDAINTAHGHAKFHAKKVSDAAYARAGPQIDFAKKFVGPRGGFPSKASVDPVKDVPTAAAKPTAYTSGATSSAGAVPTQHASAGAVPATTKPSAPYSSGATSTPGVSGDVPVETHIKTTTQTANVPEEVFSKFESVPTFQGNVPLDQDKLKDVLSKK